MVAHLSTTLQVHKYHQYGRLIRLALDGIVKLTASNRLESSP